MFKKLWEYFNSRCKCLCILQCCIRIEDNQSDSDTTMSKEKYDQLMDSALKFTDKILTASASEGLEKWLKDQHQRQPEYEDPNNSGHQKGMTDRLLQSAPSHTQTSTVSS